MINAFFPVRALLYPDEASKDYANWACRSNVAHNNAVKKFLIFVLLTWLVLFLDIGGRLTYLSPIIYFVAGLFH